MARERPRRGLGRQVGVAERHGGFPITVHDDHMDEEAHVGGDFLRIAGMEHLVLHPGRREAGADGTVIYPPGAFAKEQSKVVLASVEEYLSASDYDASEKSAVRKQVYEYCEEQTKQGLDVHLQELSATIDSSDARAFTDYCAEQNIEVPEQFPVDVKELKTLVKFSGAGGGVSISFEQKHLGERIRYDMDKDLLIIQGVPPNLKDQLQRFLKGFSSFDNKG